MMPVHWACVFDLEFEMSFEMLFEVRLPRRGYCDHGQDYLAARLFSTPSLASWVEDI